MRRACGCVSAFVASVGLASVTAAEPPGVTWQGFYFGVHGTMVSAETGYPVDALDAIPSSPMLRSQVLEGFMGGLQLGYNWQLGKAVLGVEVDTSVGKVASPATNVDASLTQDGQMSSLGSARLRLGYSLGSFLPYVTGGVTWALLDQGLTCPAGASSGACAATGAFDSRSTQMFLGWTAGAGAEVALNANWSIKAEGLVGAFSAKDFVGMTGQWNYAAPVELNLSYTAKVGINYRF